MADWDSADLLSRSQTLVQEPTSGDVTSSTIWYQFLSLAQDRALMLWAAHCPHLLYGEPTALTSADGGYTYALPSSVPAYGRFELRDGRSGSLLTVGADFSMSADFVVEGTKLRVPNGRTRTFSNGLYIRYQAAPTVISASVEPVLQPAHARVLLCYDAAATWCRTIGQKDPSPFDLLYSRTLWGDPTLGDTGLMGAIKTQALGLGSDPDVRGSATFWWRRMPSVV